VAEVVEFERLVRLPQGPPRVLGLCSLRREVIPVIDLNPLGSEPDGPDPHSVCLALILRTSRGLWAIRVNREGTAVAREPLEEPAAPALEGSGLVCVGSIRRGDAWHAVIDPEATWRSVRADVEGWYCDHLGRDTTAKRSLGLASSPSG
jgi:chemotaxis signal transduction protein